jgi:hypothetical protein
MIKRIILFLTLTTLLVTISSTNLNAQKKLSFFQKVKVKKKLNEGKVLIYEENYRGALLVMREILSIDSSNATANFRVAQCQSNLDKPRLGKKYALRAINLDSEVDKEVYFVLAESYHRLGELENAKANYEIFKAKSNSRTNQDYETEKLIEQCNFAEKLIANPVNVTVENMGRNINTFNPEYAGSISADGKILVFTSRRANSKGGQIDVNSDNKYFEDIYISFWNDTTKEWSKSKPIDGSINTETHDAVLSISPDGTSIYVYRNEPGETKSGDIYVARKTSSNNFGSSKSVDEGRNVNSSYFESSASVTEDGSNIYFVSDRPGGKGQADIYTARKVGNEWSKPTNLGDSINTDSDENSVFIHPSGKILFFTSNGHQSMGSYDIFVSKKVDGKWTKAVNIGYPINTVGAEKTISVTRDLKTAYVSSTYKGSYGSSDIFRIDISNLPVLK